MLCWSFVVAALVVIAAVWNVQAGKVIVSPEIRAEYMRTAYSLFPNQESLISTRDLFNGPQPNPFGLSTHQTLDCDFVQPDPADPIGGTTPKFTCAFDYNGKRIEMKVKYDQQHNKNYDWGRPNEEVYATVVSQRLLWALGFGSDQAVPLQVNCRNCPLEPWTYIQAVQGYDQEDVLSGWLDVKLLNSGMWNTTLPVVTLQSAVGYIKLDEYIDGDAIEYIDETTGEQISGYGWPEMYENANVEHSEMVSRDALSVIASFISHCDNFVGNQGFICLDEFGGKKFASSSVENGKDKTSCEGQPFLYIHDVGGTLGYGWNLKHLNFWPNYFDLKQWEELSIWGDVKECKVQVNGLPGCSWTKNLQVSEEGRALAARLLAQLTDKQITDVFTAARANLMRNDSVADWISGFKMKLQRDVLGITCGTTV